MDYEKATEELNKGSKTYKPTIGVQKITILSEPEECEYEDGTTGNKTPQIKMQVKIDEDELTWFVSKGKTTQSVYGQLIFLGKVKGKLKDEVITLVVNSHKEDGKTRNAYTITEAIEAIKSEGIDEEFIK